MKVHFGLQHLETVAPFGELARSPKAALNRLASEMHKHLKWILGERDAQRESLALEGFGFRSSESKVWNPKFKIQSLELSDLLKFSKSKEFARNMQPDDRRSGLVDFAVSLLKKRIL